MNRDQLKAMFDQQAPSYDLQWAKLSAIRDGLHLVSGAVLGGLAAQSRLLCVGAGTGAEIAYLADKFPGWTFTVVEPAVAMLDACRQRLQEQGCAERCSFHAGYLETLPATAEFDGATCFLVSQFILERSARTTFFRDIAERLRPGGILASADLSFDINAAAYPDMLAVWLRLMATTTMSPENLERLREAYRRDVAVLPAADIEAIIAAGGFEPPVPFYQAGLIRAWYARRAG